MKQEKTKGQIYKEKYKFSKSIKRAMQKQNIDLHSEGALNLYKDIRRKRKKDDKRGVSLKHDRVKAGRGSKTKTTKKNENKETAKNPETKA